jgi:bifunctional DNA-binding transcriptional regulator/antitoxin component of YhaV-PrlF toxin-antitoxin module
MIQVHTKVTDQEQVFVPATICSLLGITPGAVLQWTREGDHVVLRRVGSRSTLEVYKALFPVPEPVGPAMPHAELKLGIRQRIRRRQATG